MVRIEIGCCEKIIFDSKELKEKIWMKKEEVFTIEIDHESRIKNNSFMKKIFFILLTDGEYEKRYNLKEYKLNEDIIKKYIECPICNKPIFFNTEFTSDIIKQYNTTFIKEYYTEWTDTNDTYY